MTVRGLEVRFRELSGIELCPVLAHSKISGMVVLCGLACHLSGAIGKRAPRKLLRDDSQTCYALA
jgi:hypothetical protein